MPLELQPKLLRVLQDGRFRRVGGTADISCQATVIASSNRPLAQEATAGRFRRNLYYRLAVFPVTIPPLQSQERRMDIPLLAEYFLANSTIADGHGVRGFTREAMAALVSHSWPGNVRELRNVVDRAILLAGEGLVDTQSVQFDEAEVRTAATEPEVQAARPEYAQDSDPGEFSLQAAEKMFIVRALKKTCGHRTKAAMLLGITRTTHCIPSSEITDLPLVARRKTTIRTSSLWASGAVSLRPVRSPATWTSRGLRRRPGARKSQTARGRCASSCREQPVRTGADSLPQARRLQDTRARCPRHVSVRKWVFFLP